MDFSADLDGSISDLNNVSEILERLFLTRTKKHVKSSSSLSPSQSTYR